MIRLKNVIDTRTGQYHSVAIVKEKNVKYFIPGEPPEAAEAEEAEE